MVGYVLRFFPVYQELKKIINNKTYGTVTSFETTVGSYLPSWRPNIDYKKSVSANTALGGGTLLELSHEIDLTLWCLGFPQYLNAHIENTGELEIDCEDVGDIKLTYNGGLTAKIHMDFLKKIPERKTTITFEKATITCDAIAGTLEITALNSDGDNDTKTLNFKPENPQQPFLDEIKRCKNFFITKQTSRIIMKNIKELLSLKNRTAIITGGAGHLGRAFCETLSELGADLLQKQSIIDTCHKIEKKYDCIDILVNNAAYVGTSNLKGWAVPFEEQSTDCWTDALQVNLTAMFELSHALNPAMKKSKHSSIVNVSSIYGLCGPDMGLYEGTKMGNPAAYAASKGGVIQLTRWLATTLAPIIRVNTITPGGVERGQNEDFQNAYIKRTPMGRMATEEDLKGALAYLASDLSAYVTGQNIIVDGGWTAW